MFGSRFAIFLAIGIFLVSGTESSATLKQNFLNSLYTVTFLVPGFLHYVYEVWEFDRQEFPDTKVKNGSTYDFVVVGAGSAGAIVAARLSEIENASVLLIEAGGKEYKFYDIPLLKSYSDALSIEWDFRAEPSDKYCLGMKNHACPWYRGKGTGGSSLVNGMIDTIGNRADYDGWEALGNTGWGYDQVIKYFKKLETNKATNYSDYDPSYRGSHGPVIMNFSPYHSKVADALVNEASRERGYRNLDVNGKQQIGWTVMQTTTEQGSRESSNSVYLHPIRDRKNLHLTRHSLATRVLIDAETKTAKGVEYIRGGKRYLVKAKNEVILSAGTLQSPQLLMLSGIGPREQLDKFGIPVIKDAPGVGENLMDHVNYVGSIFLINTTDTILPLTFAEPWNPAIAQYFWARKGPLTTPATIDAIGFVDVDNPENRDGAPNIEMMFADLSTVFDDPLYWHILMIDPVLWKKTYKEFTNRYAWQIYPILLHPKSRGRLLLRSKDPRDKIKIIPNYYDHPDDMKVMLRAINDTLAWARTQAMQKFNSTLVPKPIYGCEKHVMNSDAYNECGARTLTSTFWHFAGTSKMGPASDPTAVVDPRLKVF